ncbi:MAG: transposon-transfer assisting family protein [Veillonella sp.]|uniref:transposon-transfer assisting family protein n=1 Tax=Veillonella sp. TaxID=1926307 RepID=UPI002900DF73|nr:transposon-transfer assisting family protein [Veillonella sp.]MDU2702375.1 transposon-transfer assisting family protein [Veillonella sp.]
MRFKNLTMEEITFLRGFKGMDRSETIINIKKTMEYSEEINVKKFIKEILEKIEAMTEEEYKKINLENYIDAEDIEEII